MSHKKVRGLAPERCSMVEEKVVQGWMSNLTGIGRAARNGAKMMYFELND